MSIIHDPMEFQQICKDASGNEYYPSGNNPCPKVEPVKKDEKKSMFSRIFGKGGKSRRHKKSFRKTMKKGGGGGRNSLAAVRARVDAKRAQSARIKKKNRRGYGGNNTTRKRMKGGIPDMGIARALGLKSSGPKFDPNACIADQLPGCCTSNSNCPKDSNLHSWVPAVPKSELLFDFQGPTKISYTDVVNNIGTDKFKYCTKCFKVMCEVGQKTAGF